MTEIATKGALLKGESGIQTSILQFFQDAVKKKLFDAVMLPMKVPSGDSFAWIMIKEQDILKDAQPLAPIMPVNAAKALKRYTRKGSGKYKVAVLMRPCEIRATVELTKLNQVNLENVTLFSYDCVGALPMQDYIADPSGGDKKFDKLIKDQEYNSSDVKPVCKICDKFSLSASDLHFAFSDKEIILVSNSGKGDDLLTNIMPKAETDLSKWNSE